MLSRLARRGAWRGLLVALLARAPCARSDPDDPYPGPIVADDSFELWEDGNATRSSWPANTGVAPLEGWVQGDDFAELLIDSRHIVAAGSRLANVSMFLPMPPDRLRTYAMTGRDLGRRSAAMIAAFSDGTRTSQAWRCTTTRRLRRNRPDPAWLLPRYQVDETLWPYAHEQEHDQSPWRDPSGFWVNTEAMWIWSSDPRRDNIVFCRYVCRIDRRDLSTCAPIDPGPNRPRGLFGVPRKLNWVVILALFLASMGCFGIFNWKLHAFCRKRTLAREEREEAAVAVAAAAEERRARAAADRDAAASTGPPADAGAAADVTEEGRQDSANPHAAQSRPIL